MARPKQYKNMSKQEKAASWIEAAYYWLDKNEIKLAAADFKLAVLVSS